MDVFPNGGSQARYKRECVTLVVPCAAAAEVTEVSEEEEVGSQKS